MPMKELTVREMRQSYTVLKEALEAEGEVILTHHGKPFARVVPINQPKPFRSHAKLRAGMPYQEIPSAVYIREDRDAR
jgi:antitoxin (DNA-binding transcriptional repressor) of toxin-antitoxin stability system